MRESIIEAYLRDKVKVSGGIAYKFVSPGNSGVPDRLVLLPGGDCFFVELKAPGKEPTSRQLYQHKKLRALGFQVFIIDSKEKVDEFINGFASRKVKSKMQKLRHKEEVMPL
jgi:hypothetical protein